MQATSLNAQARCTKSAMQPEQNRKAAGASTTNKTQNCAATIKETQIGAATIKQKRKKATEKRLKHHPKKFDPRMESNEPKDHDDKEADRENKISAKVNEKRPGALTVEMTEDRAGAQSATQPEIFPALKSTPVKKTINSRADTRISDIQPPYVIPRKLQHATPKMQAETNPVHKSTPVKKTNAMQPATDIPRKLQHAIPKHVAQNTTQTVAQSIAKQPANVIPRKLQHVISKPVVQNTTQTVAQTVHTENRSIAKKPATVIPPKSKNAIPKPVAQKTTPNVTQPHKKKLIINRGGIAVDPNNRPGIGNPLAHRNLKRTSEKTFKASKNKKLKRDVDDIDKKYLARFGNIAEDSDEDKSSDEEPSDVEGLIKLAKKTVEIDVLSYGEEEFPMTKEIEAEVAHFALYIAKIEKLCAKPEKGEACSTCPIWSTSKDSLEMLHGLQAMIIWAFDFIYVTEAFEPVRPEMAMLAIYLSKLANICWCITGLQLLTSNCSQFSVPTKAKPKRSGKFCARLRSY